MNLPEVIETGRLALRPLRAADAGPMAYYAGDRSVAEMLEHVPHPYPPGAAEAYIERVLANRVPEQVRVLDASRIEGPEFIGLVRMRRVDETGETQRISGWVGSPFRNTGYANEAGVALIRAARDIGVKRFQARIIDGNDVSAHLLLNAGFVETGRGEVFSVARGAMAPSRCFTLEFQQEGRA